MVKKRSWCNGSHGGLRIHWVCPVLVRLRLAAPIILDIYYGVSLFVVGILGCFVVRKNLVIVLMALELMFIGISLNFVVYSIYLDDMIGQLIGLFILVVAAAESSIGLAMIVIYYKLRGIINVSLINMLKG